MPRRYVRLESGRLEREETYYSKINRINKEGPRRPWDLNFITEIGFGIGYDLESERYLRDTLRTPKPNESAFERVFGNLTEEELGFDSTAGSLTVKRGRSNLASRLEKIFTGEDEREELERVANLSSSVEANDARKDLNRRLKEAAGYIGFRTEDSQREIVKKQKELEVTLEEQESEAISNYRSTLVQQLVEAGGTEDIETEDPRRGQTPSSSVLSRLARL